MQGSCTSIGGTMHVATWISPGLLRAGAPLEEICACFAHRVLLEGCQLVRRGLDDSWREA